jgi:hypothetical protein
MAVTPLEYDDIVDIRWNPFASGGAGGWEPFGIGQPTVGYGSRAAETRLVPATSPFVVKLYEMPQLNAPSTTDITLEVGGTQLQEVSIADTPGNLEYRVVYPDALGVGLIEFNSGQAGQNVVIKYYGLGHITQKISLDTRVPNSGNTTIGGVKLFTNGARGIYEETGNRMSMTIIPIGDWNMNATGGGSSQIFVAHGLSGTLWKNIRMIDVTIRRDDDA